MEPLPNVKRSVAERVADYLVANIDEMGPKSKKEIAVMFDIGEETARNSFRIADEQLATQGRTLTVPEGQSGWRVRPTSNELDLAVTSKTRMVAMMRELGRYRMKGEATSERDPQVARLFGDCHIAIELAVEALDGIIG